MVKPLCASAAAVGVLVLTPASASALASARYERVSGLAISSDATGNLVFEAGFFGSVPAGLLPFEYVLHGQGETVEAGGGCALNGGAARCAITGIRAVTVSLSAAASSSAFRFFGGADVSVRSGPGVDQIRTNAGDDLIESGAGNDELRGEGGSNVLRGGDGDDLLFGGGLLEPGSGRDTVSAGPGDDVIRARDAETDTILCGGGSDALDIDLKDGRPPIDCEKVDQGAVGEGPHVRVRTSTVAAGRSGRFTVALSCPRAVERCAGRVTVAVSGSGGAARSYSIGRGRSEAVRMRLGPSARRALARRGRLAARLTSVETGGLGPKTIRQLRVVRRRAATAHAAPARAAQAGVASSTVTFAIGDGLRIEAQPDVANRVVVRALTSPPRFRVQDDAARIVAGPGCATVSVVVVECRSFGPRTIRAFLGDRDDRLEFAGDVAGGADVVIDGGPSFDRLQGADGYDVLIGGLDGGFDALDGHAGNDVLLGGPGNDTLTGGAGNDRVFGDLGADNLLLADGALDRYCDTTVSQVERDSADVVDCG